jgi:hypothetical protein
MKNNSSVVTADDDVRQNHRLSLAAWWRALVIALPVLLGACATNGQGGGADPLTERAKARWAALLSGDLETAYTYYSPGYRSTHSVVDFGVSYRMRRVQQTSAEYVDQSCESNRCTLNFNVGISVNRPVPGMDVFEGVQKISETWIKSDGEWWFVPKN